MALREPLVMIALLGVAGCAAQGEHVAIRAQSSAPVPLSGSAAERVAYGDAQYGLGNVALALESYRRAARQEPANLAALLGTARCYDAMGRFDLARRTYESALALAPSDGAILAALAASLSAAGDTTGAARVRQEIASRAAGSVTVALPTAQPQPAAALTAMEDVAVPQTQSAEASASRPRIERLSLGEVALVTRGPIRWAALPQGDRADAAVLVLNAAREAGLAARTRAALMQRGWRRIVIGDAPRVREKSLVIYPSGRRAEAERLAKGAERLQLQPGSEPRIVVLLGRDAGTRWANRLER